MEGWGSCGLSAKLGKRRAAAPFPGLAGTDFRGRRPGASPLGCSSSLFCLQAEILAESTHGPREGGRKKGHPLGDACRVGPAPPALYSGGVSSPPPVSREAIRSYTKGGPQDISGYICSSHFSETQHRGSQGKAWGQGGGAQNGQWGHRRLCPVLVWRQLPVAAGPAGAGTSCLTERRVGSSGQRGGGGGAKEAGSVLLVGCLGTMGAAGRGRAGE